MKNLFSVLGLIIVPFIVQSQTRTMSATGNWNVAANWVGSNIGDLVTETVVINTNVNPTIIAGTSYTAGATTLNNNNTLTINSTGTLNVGNATNAFSLTTNMNASISVSGTLEIWGDLIANSNLTLTIATGGKVIIHGKLQLSGAGTNININGGTLTVNGNFTGLSNVNVNINSPGKVDVGGNVNVSGGSNLNGCAGCFHLHGTCTGPASFCGSGTLPIVLASFEAKSVNEHVQLNWTTASENNFDKFIIERSVDGHNFEYMNEQPGAGNSKQFLEYLFKDSNPILGKNYYRLKSVDFDLNFEYSNVVVAEFEGKKNVTLYPNPSSGKSIQVHTNFAPLDGDRIEFYDNLGLKLMEFNISDYESVLQLNGTLKQGSYLVRYISNDHTQVIRFYSGN